MQKTTFPLLTKRNYLYDKLIPSYFRYLISLSLEHYVKILMWIGYKLMLHPKFLDLDNLFPYFHVFHVDLVQIIQVVLKWTFANKVIQI